jgi:hypothetical protein
MWFLMNHDGLIGSEKIWDRCTVFASRLQSFETGMLAGNANIRQAVGPQPGIDGVGGGGGRGVCQRRTKLFPHFQPAFRPGGGLK